MRECCEKTLAFLSETVAEEFAEKRRYGNHVVPFQVPCLGCSAILEGRLNIDVTAVEDDEQSETINPTKDEIDDALAGIELATKMYPEFPPCKSGAD